MSNTGRISFIVLVVLLAVLLFFLLFAQDNVGTEATTPDAVTMLVDVDGDEVGTVQFFELADEGVVEIVAHVEGVAPGFHGFHLHTTGSCESTDEGAFQAAGGHWNPGAVDHGEHSGDLPVLYVTADGIASLRTTTDRFVVAELFDDDGTAVIIHANADNYANIPERYGTPDEATLGAGDAGGRVACGVIEQAAG